MFVSGGLDSSVHRTCVGSGGGATQVQQRLDLIPQDTKNIFLLSAPRLVLDDSRLHFEIIFGSGVLQFVSYLQYSTFFGTTVKSICQPANKADPVFTPGFLQKWRAISGATAKEWWHWSSRTHVLQFYMVIWDIWEAGANQKFLNFLECTEVARQSKFVQFVHSTGPHCPSDFCMFVVWKLFYIKLLPRGLQQVPATHFKKCGINIAVQVRHGDVSRWKNPSRFVKDEVHIQVAQAIQVRVVSFLSTCFGTTGCFHKQLCSNIPWLGWFWRCLIVLKLFAMFCSETSFSFFVATCCLLCVGAGVSVYHHRTWPYRW